MANIRTIAPERAGGLKKLFFRWVRGQYGGVVPGVFQVLAVDLRVARPAGSLTATCTCAALHRLAGSSARCWQRSSTARSAAPPDWDCIRRQFAA